MQSVDKKGILGEPIPFNADQLSKMLSDPNIDHVDVFEGTEENIKNRKKLAGKKYKVAKRFQKAPRIKK